MIEKDGLSRNFKEILDSLFWAIEDAGTMEEPHGVLESSFEVLEQQTGLAAGDLLAFLLYDSAFWMEDTRRILTPMETRFQDFGTLASSPRQSKMLLA